jgi:hypothetical protein
LTSTLTKPRFLGQSEHPVHVLHRLSARALDEVVDRRDDDDEVLRVRRAEVALVRALHAVELGEPARVDLHEALAGVGLREAAEEVLRARPLAPTRQGLQVERREDPAEHGQEVGDEHDPRRPGLLVDLGDVTVRADRVRAEVLLTDPKCVREVGERPAPETPLLQSATIVSWRSTSSAASSGFSASRTAVG